MLRRIAAILGLAWSFLFASLVARQAIGCIRDLSLPPRESWSALGLQLLLYGTMAFLCFAVAAASKAPPEKKTPEDGGDE
jgi:hypothetical protein